MASAVQTPESAIERRISKCHFRFVTFRCIDDSRNFYSFIALYGIVYVEHERNFRFFNWFFTRSPTISSPINRLRRRIDCPIFLFPSARNGLIISAKKYLKMPAATEQPAAKKERDELLWQALKEHIMRERQKKKEGRCTPVLIQWK